MDWKRGEREKEKVCLEPDLLVGDWLIWLKLAIESRQYLSFIKIIYKDSHPKVMIIVIILRPIYARKES